MFSAEQDSEALRKAMKGFGTDEAAIIQIIAHRTNQQRQEIKHVYKTKYDRDLIKDLKSDWSGHFEDVVLALFESPSDYDANQIHKAMKGLGTDEDTLIEIIASKYNYQLKEWKERYKQIYNKTLESAISSECGGDLKKLLLELLKCNRSDNRTPNEIDMAGKARELFEAGEKRWGTDESIFFKIFSTASPWELVEISNKYQKLSGNTILQAVEKEFSGNLKKALQTILHAITAPSEYFASRIYKAIKGWGTNNKIWIRVIVTRKDIDMPMIKHCYKQLYGKDLVDAIIGDTSGDYKKILVELVSQ